MFVPMIAEPAHRLSERPAELQPHARGFGDRFFYFRGISGRRYLFTHIDPADLADFTEAVVVTAESSVDGRLAIRSVGLGANAPQTPGREVLVHLLAADESERRTVLEDLAGVRLRDVMLGLDAARQHRAQRLSSRWAASRSSSRSRTPMSRRWDTVLTT